MSARRLCKHGEQDVTEQVQLTLEVRRDCETEYLRRATAFMRDAAAHDTPFFVYFNHSLMHMPVIPRGIQRADLTGRLGRQPARVGHGCRVAADLLDELGITANTLVVFAGNNGPEEVLLRRGRPGFWEGSYFACDEGTLRTPCIVRRP